MTTMLALCQQAMPEMGLASPSTVAGNTDQNVVQTLALMNAAQYELQRQYQWQAITKEYRFTAVAYNYTATVASGSTTITAMSSTTGLTATPTYFSVTGNGILQDTYLLLVDAGLSTGLLSATPNASGTLVPLTFSQTKYALPSDYDRKIDMTDWDKSQHWQMLGPETAQQWQWLKSGYISTGPRIRFRILGGTFQIWPPSGITDILGFEYVSNLVVTSALSTTGPDKTAFTLDTDVSIFPDRLLVLGAKLKFWEIKGFDTTAMARDYSMQLDIAKANDAGSPTLSFAPQPSQVLLGYGNVPDAGYGT